MKTNLLSGSLLELLGLPASSRAFLAEKLLASLEEKEEPSEAVERAWKKEALRRYKAIQTGKVKTRPHAEVMRDVRRMLKKK